jgi:hypothetical protein
MIVLRIADTHDVLTQESQVRQYGGKARALIGAARQDHHRLIVEDDLQAKVQLPDGWKNGDIVRSHCGHNALSHGKGHALPAQMGDEFARDLGAKEALFASEWVVKQSAVLGDNRVKKMEAGKHRAQAGKFAARDQDELASRFPPLFQTSDGLGGDPTIAGQGAIVIRGYGAKSHRVMLHLITLIR